MIPRRIRSLAAVAAVVSLASLPAAAAAQPACVAGILSDYLALAGGCTIDGVAFTDFEATFGAFNVPARLSFVSVTPFGGGGQVGFNLALNQPLSVTATGAVGLAFAERTFEFDFTTHGVGSGGTIGASPFSLFTASVAAARGGPVTGSQAMATLAVASRAAGHTIVLETSQHDGDAQASACGIAGQLPPDVLVPMFVPCTPLITTGFVDGAVAVVGTVDAWGSDNAPASASLANLGVTIGVPPAAPLVTPEPPSVPLVASGLGLLALVARRRRVAPTGETV